MKRKKRSILLWVVLFIFLTTYNYDVGKNQINSFFSIKKIEISGIEFTKKKDLEDKFNSLKNKNLILIKKSDFVEITKEFQFIEELKIKKIYPNKIKVTINEFMPIAYFIDNKKKYVLTNREKKIINYDKKKIGNLPLVVGKGADKKFSIFYSVLKANNFNVELIKQFNYFDINRWDIILKDDKVIKLPSEDYERSIVKFLSIYGKGNFKDFKVFDFRVDNQLILK